jgi:acetyl esterase/lipase
MYPAVRDIKAALRWIHANAKKYNADTSSITLQGGSAGATAVIELALTGGDDTFADDYTGELTLNEDRTLSTANVGQPATVTGLIDYWGGIFAADLMQFKDGKPRWSTSSVPTIAFHGTADTTVSPNTGQILCGNLTTLGVPCHMVSLPEQKHACWYAQVTLPGGAKQSIFDYAFDMMANMSNWTVIGPTPGPGPGGKCSPVWKQCGGKNWSGPTCCDGSCVCTGTVWHKQCKPKAGQRQC